MNEVEKVLLAAAKSALDHLAKHEGCSRTTTALYIVTDQLRTAIAKAEKVKVAIKKEGVPQ